VKDCFSIQNCGKAIELNEIAEKEVFVVVVNCWSICVYYSVLYLHIFVLMIYLMLYSTLVLFCLL